MLIIVAIGLGIGLSLKYDIDDPAVTKAQVHTFQPMTLSVTSNPSI